MSSQQNSSPPNRGEIGCITDYGVLANHVGGSDESVTKQQVTQLQQTDLGESNPCRFLCCPLQNNNVKLSKFYVFLENANRNGQLYRFLELNSVGACLACAGFQTDRPTELHRSKVNYNSFLQEVVAVVIAKTRYRLLGNANKKDEEDNYYSN